jgi:galactokinase
VREEVGDRAVLRAIHVYDENQRVKLQKKALQAGDFNAFLSYVTESGLSSWRYLQNVIPAGRKEKQEVAFALTIAEKLLNGRGACRVHGGGFAGTIQAFVPNEYVTEFNNAMTSVFGADSAYVLKVRLYGAVQLEKLL